MKARKKVILIVGLCVVSLLFAGSAILLFRGIKLFGAEEKKLTRSKGELETFYRKNPFPSRKNVLCEGENARITEDWMKKLMRELMKGHIEAGKPSPSKFKSLFSRKKNSFMEMAIKSGTAVNEGFAFGFTRYAGGVLPAPEDVPVLTKQLVIIEKLFTFLCEEKVKEVISIEREVFETDLAARDTRTSARSSAGRTRRSRGSRRTVRKQTPSPAGQGESVVDAKDLYSKLHFIFVFKAKETAIMNILNLLASDDMFVVVTSVNVSKEEADVLAGGAVKVSEEDEVDTKPERDAAVQPTRMERMVAGLELEVPKKVYLELDVYSFKADKSGSGAGDSK